MSKSQGVAPVKDTGEKRLFAGKPGPGRRKGVPNKTTIEFRETITRLLEDNSSNIAVWLGQVASDDPGKALDLIAKLAEFAAPKLGRTELTGADGGAIETIGRIELVAMSGNGEG